MDPVELRAARRTKVFFVDYRLSKHESFFEGCQRVAHEEIQAVLASISDCRAGSDPDNAIHEVRTHLKKLRALVRLLRPAIGEEAFVRETGTFRRAASKLSANRDANVFVQSLGELSDLAGESERQVVEKARRYFAQALDAERLPSDESFVAIEESLQAARRCIAEWVFACAESDAVSEGFEKCYRRARKARDAAADTPSTECFHRWRRRTKELWSALRLIRGVGSKPLKHLMEGSRDLAEALGKDHDLAILKDRLLSCSEAARLDGDDILLLAHLIDTKQAALQREAWKLSKHLFKEKAGRFGGRVSGCWEEWNEPAEP